MTSPHAIYRRTDLLPTGSGTTVLFSTIGGPKVRGIAAWVTLVVEHSHLGTVNLYWTNDGGTNWYLADTEEFVPVAESSQREFFVEPYSDIKLEWVNGGTNQTTFQLTMSISQQRGGAASGASDLSQAALWDTALYATAYGADPTGVADSTAALQAWLDATADTGRMGRITAGDYRITDTLYVAGDGGAIKGDGRKLVNLTWDGATDDGKAMMVWSRHQGSLEGVTFTGNYKATYGFVAQNALGSRVSIHITSTLRHAVYLHNTWEGMVAGFNENLVFDQLNIDSCGRWSYQGIKLTGTGLGGTFTLTVDGFTTGNIAFNADAATVAAAILAANPGLAGWLSYNGTNPFETSGNLTDANGMALAIKGRLSGEEIDITMDTTLITGAITTATVTVFQEPFRANGFHTDSTGGGDNGTVSIFEPEIRGCVGHGIMLFGQGFKVFGGHLEGNYDCGVFLGEDAPESSTVDNLILWPWLEGNIAGGIVPHLSIGQANRNLALVAGGMQPVESSDGVTRLAADSGYLQVTYTDHGGANYGALWLSGTGAFSADGGGVRRSLLLDTPGESTQAQYVHTVAGNLALDGRTSAHKEILFQANGTIFLSAAQANVRYTFRLVQGAAGPYVVAFGDPIKWVGGAAPAIGGGGANSVDIIDIEVRGGVAYEVGRFLDLR